MSEDHVSTTAFGRDRDPDRVFRHMFNSAGVAMIGTDRELRIRSWNLAAMRLFGASAARMVGTDALGIVPQPRRQVARRVLNRAIQHAESNTFEFAQRDARGRERELAIAITPIADDDGTRVGALICVRDITRRVRAVEQVHESRKMASLGEMAGEIAHHFNNILGGVVTSVDFALAGDDEALCRRTLTQTAQAVARASTLLRGLLVFAEGEPRHEDRRDLRELIESLSVGWRRRAEEHGIEVRLDLTCPAPILVVRDAVATVLGHLTDNAIDAMPDGGVLSVDAESGPDCVRVRIRDTGRGMAPDELQRIFEPFYRTRESRPHSAPMHARGLGLAVAFGIMKRLGGSISAESTRGEGSCFEVSIPTG